MEYYLSLLYLASICFYHIGPPSRASSLGLSALAAGWPPWVRDHFLILFFLCGASPIVATELLQKGIVLADQCNGHNLFVLCRTVAEQVNPGSWTCDWAIDLLFPFSPHLKCMWLCRLCCMFNVFFVITALPTRSATGWNAPGGEETEPIPCTANGKIPIPSHSALTRQRKRTCRKLAHLRILLGCWLEKLRWFRTKPIFADLCQMWSTPPSRAKHPFTGLIWFVDRKKKHQSWMPAVHRRISSN